jgi:hypothetical protein
LPVGVPLSPAQYKTAFALLCQNISDYNRQAADLANKLWEYPKNVAVAAQVTQILKWDDKYRAELIRRKYLQENRKLPEDAPVKDYRSQYKVPTTGVELGLSLRNLAKNVSVWKKRVGNERYPDADQKHAMYAALYADARTKANTERNAKQK